MAGDCPGRESSPAAVRVTQQHRDPAVGTAAQDSLTEFVLQPGPEDAAVQCRITRNSLGLDKGRVVSKMKIISANKEKLP